MNERIRELAELSGFKVDWQHEDVQAIKMARFEKFAELIVGECVQVCADRGAHHDGLYSAWADDCSKRIGKHFGVEK